MRKEHPKLVFVKHTFCCLSCHIHSILSRGSVCCLACDDLSFLNWRNVCEAFTKDTFYVALPLYCDLFSCLRLLCFWIHVFLCCFHFFFCIRKIKWDSVIHTANLVVRKAHPAWCVRSTQTWFLLNILKRFPKVLSFVSLSAFALLASGALR